MNDEVFRALVINLEGQAKKRSITIHPEIIFRIIDSQSGTLAKAFSEYCMNSIDASASKVNIELDSSGFKVSDDGPGFHGLEEIEGFFETLGFPHDENDHRTYGSFGIGRAQMWSFASTVWRTGEFEMNVDIKTKGLDYELRTGLELSKGCDITGRFYTPLNPLQISNTIKELQTLLLYVETPIIVNGQQINKSLASEKWTETTDDAYIKKSASGDLKVYNLGVLVTFWSEVILGIIWVLAVP